MLVLKSWEQKQGTAHVPCTQHPRGGPTTCATPLARPLDPPLPSPHSRNQLAPPRGAGKGKCCLFLLPLLQPEPQQSLARISCLASDQRLQIKGVKKPGQSAPAGPLQGSLFTASGVEAPFYLLFREGGEGQPVLQGIRGNTGFFAGGHALIGGCGLDGDRPVPFHP